MYIYFYIFTYIFSRIQECIDKCKKNIFTVSLKTIVMIQIFYWIKNFLLNYILHTMMSTDIEKK